MTGPREPGWKGLLPYQEGKAGQAKLGTKTNQLKDHCLTRQKAKYCYWATAR